MTDPNVNKGKGDGFPTSLSLIERVKAKDPQSWDLLVALYAPLVYRWCRGARLQPVDAEDVGQEVFRSVFRKIGTFHRDRPGDTFHGWLRTITQRKILDHRKKGLDRPPACGGSDARRQLEGLPADPSDDSVDAIGGEDANGDEQRILVRQALKQIEGEFKPQTWQAFWAVVMEGRTTAEVARTMDVTPNVVYLAKSRVRRRFLEEYKGLIEPKAPL